MTEPFIGSEAVAAGFARKHQLRANFRSVYPNVYVPDEAALTLPQRARAAWLWSHRQGVIAGLAASALHGAKWVDADVPIEMIWHNARTPKGIVTRADLLLDDERRPLHGILVTTPERTAFDLGRRGPVTRAVARLDALTRATGLKVPDVERFAAQHRRVRGLRQLEAVLRLVDPGAESPQETWLRLLLMRNGYPRPRTQIPVLSPDRCRRYFLDMGWESIMLAVEYDGDHHRTDRDRFAYDIERSHDLDELGWLVVRVAARSHEADVLRRVQRAWTARTR
jgi:very-short-patch-repair endonuclease